MDIYELQEKIKDRKDFELFLKLLYKDFLNNREEWENTTLEHFLESLYASNQETTDAQNKEVVSWALFADLLLTAKVYE